MRMCADIHGEIASTAIFSVFGHYLFRNFRQVLWNICWRGVRSHLLQRCQARLDMTPVKAGVFPRCVVLWLNFYTAKVTLDNLENHAILLITNMSSKIVY